MIRYELVHVPFTSGERMTLDDDDMDLDEAKEKLQARADRIEKKYPGCTVDWISDTRIEVTDDTAAMIGDYQGNTFIVGKEEPDEDYADEEDDRDHDNPVESANYDNHDWAADPDWGPG